MMPREGTVIADRYRLERKVGGGRVSAVWRVHDEISEATCAVKLLHRSMHKHSEALTRFSLEDRLARELSGPHFPERVGSGSWNGMRYIAWRWHEGESLRALFDRNPKQDAPTVHSIVQETCQALAEVHAAGYTHGDLKPENMFFADRGDNDASRQLKLIGFGVASRIVPFTASSAPRRAPGHIVGTPLYLSPDLILGRTPKGGQADLWSLGVIVYEALTGRAPFLGNDLGAVLEAILKRDAPRPSHIADHLPGTFDLWWAQVVEQEFKTPSDFASSLSRALGPALRSSHTQRSAALPERALPERASQEKPSEPSPLASLSPAVVPRIASGQAARSRAINGTAVNGAAVKGGTMPTALATLSTSSTASGLGPLPSSGSSVTAPPHSAAEAKSADGGASDSPGVEPKPNESGDSRDDARGSDPVSTEATSTEAKAHEKKTDDVKPNEGQPNPAATDPGTFAPLPSPLRDFSMASRKTLVGITPPVALQAPPFGLTPAAPKSATAGPRAIGGAPCKSIEVSAVVPVDDTPGLHGFETIRRPANPTVPFPRPRLLPRHTAAEEADLGDASLSGGFPGHLPGSGRPSATTWRASPSRTLSFVLTSADHRPQRIAAVLVCAAAALVIFAVGRSPIAGTASIGQTTGALSKDPATAAPSPRPEAAGTANADAPLVADGKESELGARRGADDAVGSAPAPAVEAPARGREVAPGLVIPQAGAQSGLRSSAPATATPRAPAQGPVQRPARTLPAPGKAAPPPPPRTEPVRPSGRKTGEPPSKSSTDFDFGI